MPDISIAFVKRIAVIHPYSSCSKHAMWYDSTTVGDIEEDILSEGHTSGQPALLFTVDWYSDRVTW